MPASIPPRRWRAAMLLLLLPALVVVACSSDKKTASSSASSAATTTTVPCPGKPIRVTTVGSVTGAISFGTVGRDLKEGTQAALEAVNAKCEAGRPLEVNICDDQSDPNQSTACGTKAKDDGSLALFGWLGRSDNAATAAGLPVLLTRNQTTFELTSPMAYPATSVLSLALGSVSAAAGAGAKTYLFIVLDDPAVQAEKGLLDGTAAKFGVTTDYLIVPNDTTDFAPIAAQVAQRNPDAIAVVLPGVVPLMNALNAEGITPKSKPFFTSTDLIPPDVIQQLGNKLDGFYLISDVVPAQDSSNAGIQQMLKEYQSAGIKTAQKDIGAMAVLMWSRVHVLAETISGLDAAKRDSLTGQQLADALVARGRIARPELAPFDLSKPAFADIPPLGSFRVFSDQAMVVQVQDGTYKTVTPFGDIRKPFKIQLG